jgi:8-oxo-dGTP pyrophosphatase MutT (NUDIX family)
LRASKRAGTLRRSKRWHVSPQRSVYPRPSCSPPSERLSFTITEAEGVGIPEVLMVDVESAPAQPRPAATVLVARDAEGEVEFLLAQRSASLRFMGGAHVFPGGGVQASDRSAEAVRITRVAALPWPGSIDPELDRAHVFACIRETLEEVGLLLGTAIATEQLVQLRTETRSDRDFAECLANLGLSLDLSALVPLIRWITPTSEPMRFDTRFYVARAPEDQHAEADARETVSLIWRSARAAIEEADRGVMRLSPPTRRTLQEIARVMSVSELLAKARAGSAPTVEPILRVIDGKRMILYPGDPDHPVASPALGGPLRSLF